MTALFIMLLGAAHYYPVMDKSLLQKIIQKDPEEPKPCLGLVEDQEDGSQKCLPKRCYIEDRKRTCYDLPKQG